MKKARKRGFLRNRVDEFLPFLRTEVGWVTVGAGAIIMFGRVVPVVPMGVKFIDKNPYVELKITECN